MDPTLGQQIVIAIGPFLPFLVKLGSEASEELVRQVGSDAWKAAKQLWERLGKPVEVPATASAEALQSAVADPRIQTAVDRLIETSITEREARDLLAMLLQARPQTGTEGVNVHRPDGTTLIVQGSGNTVAGGDIRVQSFAARQTKSRRSSAKTKKRGEPQP